jgi:hypothetical protein
VAVFVAACAVIVSVLVNLGYRVADAVRGRGWEYCERCADVEALRDQLTDSVLDGGIPSILTRP